MRIAATSPRDLRLPRPGSAGRVLGSVQHAAATVGDAVRFTGQIAIGAAKEAANTGANLTNLPVYTRNGGWFRVQGVLVDPRGHGQHVGADIVDAAARAVGLLAKPADRAAERARRPLLTTLDATADGTHAIQLALDASAPGASWGTKHATSGVVSVYVDGAHTGDALVLNERDEPLTLNLGVLTKGAHSVELRDASVDGEHAVASVVHTATVSQVSEEDTLVARYQPLFEGRDFGRPDALGELDSSDAPLLLAPTVTAHPDGSHTIRYFTLFSNEDGGTSTQRLYRDYGRGTDFEHLYTVEVAADGTRSGAWYQGPLHAWRTFQGRFEGDRAVLRIGTSNNMATERSLDAGAVWSPAALPVSGTPRSLQMMLEHPWTFQVMGGELVRQDRVQPALLPDPVRIEDPRRYAYIPSSGDDVRRTLEAGGDVTLVLKDGTTRQLEMADGPSRRPENETAIELPDSVRGVDVAGVRGVSGSVWVLDQELEPRRLAGSAH